MKSHSNVIFFFLSTLKINVYFFLSRNLSLEQSLNLLFYPLIVFFLFSEVLIVNFFYQHLFFSVIAKSLIPFKIFNAEVLITLFYPFFINIFILCNLEAFFSKLIAKSVILFIHKHFLKSQLRYFYYSLFIFNIVFIFNRSFLL